MDTFLQLRLIPQAEWISAWRSDYEAMQREMFFGTPPSFDDVLATIGEFETALSTTSGMLPSEV